MDRGCELLIQTLAGVVRELVTQNNANNTRALEYADYSAEQTRLYGILETDLHTERGLRREAAARYHQSAHEIVLLNTELNRVRAQLQEAQQVQLLNQNMAIFTCPVDLANLCNCVLPCRHLCCSLCWPNCGNRCPVCRTWFADDQVTAIYGIPIPTGQPEIVLEEITDEEDEDIEEIEEMGEV